MTTTVDRAPLANLCVLVPARATARLELAFKKISAHDDIHALPPLSP